MVAEFNAEVELAKIRARKKLVAGKGEYAKRVSKLDPYREQIFDLHEKGASLSDTQNYILTNLTKEDRKKGFKLHRTTINKYILRFERG
ncbi:hypothetical protein [Psychromonas antarctica]|uniref:hypothetical protein n=1 Tax=Psychromonas antarctica TaxID=67573 RepID=UPI001EE95DAF|nr:hypothetical protein [Psychromonas antarctica]MCG6202022.1 hypothetical protein [Psychromonas antarctica]